MQTVPISKFKATCLALLDQVGRTGEPLLVTRRGKPVAQIQPPPSPREMAPWLGAMKGTVRIIGDVIAPAGDEDDWEASR